MRVEDSEIQGIIISAYPHLIQSRYILLNVHNQVDARRFLGDLLGHITTADWRDKSGMLIKPATATNVAFTNEGLVALGLQSEIVETFPEEFRRGMGHPEQSRRLGDDGESDPALWEYGGSATGASSTVHVLLILKASGEAALDQLTQQRWTMSQSSSGMNLVKIETSHPLPLQREHFGFFDGASQPEIEGSPKPSNTGSDCLKAGEFILGYPNEYGVLPATPLVPQALDPQNILRRYDGTAFTTGDLYMKDLGRNGTYLVFRKLHQDVAAFRTFVNDYAASIGSPELLAAKMIGRWPSGTSLIDSPKVDSPPLPGTMPLNDFGYADRDPHGFLCPLGAHVRRSNPRDSMSNRTPAESRVDARRHRILRRGVSYGPPLAEGVLVDDREPRGLLFQAINSDIKRQFEFIQQTWTNNPKFHGLNNDRDPLIGDNIDPTDNVSQIEPRVFTIQRDGLRVRIANIPRFVTMKGGAYFFIPSVSALRFLSNMSNP